MYMRAPGGGGNGPWPMAESRCRGDPPASPPRLAQATDQQALSGFNIMYVIGPCVA